MIKVILTTIIAVLITLGAIFGLSVSGVINLSQLLGASQTNTSISEEELKIEEQAQVEIIDILVPINNGRRQALFLLEISVYGNQSDIPFIEHNIPKIKNIILQTFSVKPESYFLDNNFFATLQKDLTQILTNTDQYKINDVLVIKAVYQ